MKKILLLFFSIALAFNLSATLITFDNSITIGIGYRHDLLFLSDQVRVPQVRVQDTNVAKVDYIDDYYPYVVGLRPGRTHIIATDGVNEISVPLTVEHRDVEAFELISDVYPVYDMSDWQLVIPINVYPENASRDDFEVISSAPSKIEAEIDKFNRVIIARVDYWHRHELTGETLTIRNKELSATMHVRSDYFSSYESDRYRSTRQYAAASRRGCAISV